jgi:hypothetical protein
MSSEHMCFESNLFALILSVVCDLQHFTFQSLVLLIHSNMLFSCVKHVRIILSKEQVLEKVLEVAINYY